MATAPNVLLLWGEDAFLLREAAIEALGGVHPVEVEAAEWQGGETSDLATPSLFGEERALLVNGCRHLNEAGAEELAAYLASPAPDARLVLLTQVAERGKPPAALVKLVQPVGEVRQVAVARKDLPAVAHVAGGTPRRLRSRRTPRERWSRSSASPRRRSTPAWSSSRPRSATCA